MGSKHGHVVLFLALFTALPGCSTPKSSGYLADYERLEKGQFLERYFADEGAIASGSYGTVVLASVATDAIQDQKGVTKAECAQWLQDALLRDSEIAESIVPSSPTEVSTAQLNVAITEMSPGSAGARIFAGELGAGHAWVQVEGTITDSQTNTTLAAFADRRRSSGAIGFEDVGGDSGPALVRRMIEAIGEDIRQELRESFGLRGDETRATQQAVEPDAE